MCGEKINIYVSILSHYLYENTYRYEITSININVADNYIIAHCREYGTGAISSEYDLIVNIDKDDNVYIRNLNGADVIRDYGDECGTTEDDIKSICNEYKEMVTKFKKENGYLDLSFR